MAPHNPTPIGISVKDAATLTSFSEWEIRQAVNSGELPAIRRGRRIALDHEELVKWFRSQTPAVESA